MSKSTRTTGRVPVRENVDEFPETSIDSEVLAFRASFESRSALDEIIREGARRMLQSAIEAEVEEFLTANLGRRDNQGNRLVVRNGHLPSREITTGAGPVEVRQPRVRDNSPNKEDRVIFSPSVLPPDLKRTKAIEELIPWLYLKSISTGDFSEALQALVGEQAKGLSPNVIVKLKEQWSQEYEDWMRRDLTGKQYVYLWADGIHVKVRLEDDANKKQCMLVVMGATADGQKERTHPRAGDVVAGEGNVPTLLDVHRVAQRAETAAANDHVLTAHQINRSLTRPASFGGVQSKVRVKQRIHEL